MRATIGTAARRAGGRERPEQAAPPVPITFDERDTELLTQANGGSAAPADAFRLGLRATELAAQPGFDRLICQPLLRDMDLLEHQVRTVRTVLQRMRGRALLCDEVGLGKTIEAGMVLAELLLRGLVRSVLILVPPSLVEQWQGELRRKFSIDTVSHDDPTFRGRGRDAWGQWDRIVASFHTAKRQPHRDAILERAWDMVIVDEAHHLRNRRTLLWQFATRLRKRYTLLLTATPVQNHMEELFNLATLLEPGLLSTARRFQQRFVDRRDKLAPRNVEQLQELLSEIMVRNRRSSVGLQFTRRWARTHQVEPAAAEQRLYERVAPRVRAALRTGDGPSRMALISLQTALGSSARAAAGTLERLGGTGPAGQEWRELAEAARSVESSAKADRLLRVLDEVDDRLVVFTHFRATQQMLLERLEGAGVEVALFHGGLGRMEKERQIDRFRRRARVLLTTDAGSEGRNLQFCNAVCNFDLPWNPMRIEQRIGRLSRIGQARDVHVINLVGRETVEAAILHLLEAKLAMFELVIGEIDMVLGNLDEDRDFPDMVAELWGASEGVDDFARRMEQLGDRLVAAKRAYFEQRAVDERIFGDRLRPEG